MAESSNPLAITVTRRIFKYAEGAEPGKDLPFEITENAVPLSEGEVLELIDKGEVPFTREQYEIAKANAIAMKSENTKPEGGNAGN